MMELNMQFFGLNLGEIIAIATIVVGIGVGYIRLQGQVAHSEKQVVSNAKAAEDALRVAREIRDELHSVRLQIAQEYVSVSNLKEVDARLTTVIGHMTSRFDRMSDRMDKLIEQFNRS